jgi:hypothetical protein
MTRRLVTRDPCLKRTVKFAQVTAAVTAVTSTNLTALKQQLRLTT